MFFFFCLATTLCAQGSGSDIVNPPVDSRLVQGTGTITIFIMDEFGEPLNALPRITVRSLDEIGATITSIQRRSGEAWVFSGLHNPDDYEVEVRVDGYQVAHEEVSLSASDQAMANLVVLMKPLSAKNDSRAPGGQFVLAPRAEKEVENGLADLRSEKFDSAEKHLEKAVQMAPGNPYVNYVMGMIYLMSKQMAQAKPFLEKSVSIDPKQPPALLALGTVRFQTQDYAGAIQVLEQAVQLDPTSWKAEWMLAGSYLRQRDYAKARDYAEKALQVGKQDAAQVQVILGEALAGLGERKEAADTFEEYLRLHPQAPDAARIHGYVERLRQQPAPAVVPVAAGAAPAVKTSTFTAGEPAAAPLVIPAPAPPVDPPPKENWAPPDVDATKPFVISSAACSLPEVLQAAGTNAVQLVTSLQQFSAIEDYESVEIKRDEQLEKPETRMFNYLVLIDEIRPGLFHVEESREASQGKADVPGPLHDEGAPGRVLIFHPNFKDDFEWTCEGLGEWKDKSAWVIHFQQRPDRPTSLLAGFQAPGQLYLLPLKGRVWVSQNGGQVMHLETDLTRAMPELGLMRQHFAIDYQPVSFQTHKVQLWLPENVDVYYQFRGHYVHNYHHYTNFKLFWVGATQNIGKPKETEKQP